MIDQAELTICLNTLAAERLGLGDVQKIAEICWDVMEIRQEPLQDLAEEVRLIIKKLYLDAELRACPETRNPLWHNVILADHIARAAFLITEGVRPLVRNLLRAAWERFPETLERTGIALWENPYKKEQS